MIMCNITKHDSHSHYIRIYVGTYKMFLADVRSILTLHSDCTRLCLLGVPPYTLKINLFSCLLQPLFFAAFSCFSLQCSDSYIPWSLWQPCLDPQPNPDCLTAHSCKSCINHGLMTHPIYDTAPSQMGPSFITHPFPFITHLFLLSFIPFIALPSSNPSHCWPPSCSPCVIFKHCPTTTSHVTGTTPAILKATCLLCIDCVTCPHQPHAVAPHLEWATIGPCYCTDHAPAVTSLFSFTTFPLFPSSTTFLPLCSLHLNYHFLSCH